MAIGPNLVFREEKKSLNLKKSRHIAADLRIWNLVRNELLNFSEQFFGLFPCWRLTTPTKLPVFMCVVLLLLPLVHFFWEGERREREKGREREGEGGALQGVDRCAYARAGLDVCPTWRSSRARKTSLWPELSPSLSPTLSLSLSLTLSLSHPSAKWVASWQLVYGVAAHAWVFQHWVPNSKVFPSVFLNRVNSLFVCKSVSFLRQKSPVRKTAQDVLTRILVRIEFK